MSGEAIYIDLLNCYFHSSEQATLVCAACSKHLCANCNDPSNPQYCYACSLGGSYEEIKEIEQSTKKVSWYLYLLIKLSSALFSTFISALITVMILGLYEGFAVIVIISLVIVVIFGVPSSMLIDLCIRKDKGISFAFKAIAHGLVGTIIAVTLYGDEGYIFLLIGLLNSILYYFVCVVLFIGLKAGKRNAN